MVLEQVETKKSWEEYISLGQEAREAKDQTEWLLGDLAASMETDYGEDSIGKYAYAIGVVKKTLMGYRTVAKRFSPETRTKYRKLSFSHFKTLASLDKPEAWLEKADDNEWSVETLSHEVSQAYQGLNPDLKEETPKVYRCPTCGLWRLSDVSAYEVCKGHYQLEEGELKYV